MSAEHVEVLVEEPSMEAALRLLLPKLLGNTTFQIYAYQCKDDLLGRLQERMCGYAKWLPPTWRILILVDRDDEDCKKLKGRLESVVKRAGLKTRTQKPSASWSVVNRIVVEELEAWYFGDWAAVCAAYPRVHPMVPRQGKFRDPDQIHGTWEALERVLQTAGYFKGGLRKVEAARKICAHMDPMKNTSRSFQAFRDALLEMAQGGH